jgi:hypothetical protein
MIEPNVDDIQWIVPRFFRNRLVGLFLMLPVCFVTRPAAMAAELSPEMLTASKDGRLNDIRKLLTSGEDVNAANADGVTALMVAAGANQVEAMRLLIQGKADIDRRTSSGNTALSFAIGRAGKEAVRVLLWAGASVSIRTPEGLTLIELARQKQPSDVAQLLTEWVENGGSSSTGPVYKPRAFPATQRPVQKEVDPELTSTLEALKAALLSPGKVNSSVVFTAVSTGTTRSVQRWETTTSVIPDARACQVRVHEDSSNGGRPAYDSSHLFLLEAVETVEAMPAKETYERIFGDTERRAEGTFWTLIINRTNDGFVVFNNQAQAAAAAEKKRRKELEVSAISPAAAGPSPRMPLSGACC